MKPDEARRRKMTYEINRMANAARAKEAELRKEGRSTTVVTWNYPSRIAIIATIGDAARMNLVSANQEGWEVIRSMVEVASDVPTVNMVRIALDLARKPPPPPPTIIPSP